MDPLERSGERCSYDGHCGRAMHERPLSELDVAKIWSRDCVQSLLNKDETSDLAHQLISWSLTRPSDTNQTASSSEGVAMEDLVELTALEGLKREKIGVANLSLLQLDLNKLSAQLPAQENYNVPLEALGHGWQVSLSVLYSLTAVVSILLNLITVIVLYRSKPSELRKYLINLAISDLCMSLFSIPFTYREYMLGYWDYPAFLCPVVRLMVTLAVYVSVCTMVVIGVNRHVAILYPMKKCSEGVWKWGKNWVILGIWLSGLVISSPEYLMFSATRFCYNQKFHLTCRNTWGEHFSYYYTIFIFLTTFVIPFALLCYFYSSIGIQLKHREMPGNANASRDLSMQTKRAKVVKMLIVVVVMFAIFWLPLQAFSMIVLIVPTMREVGEYGGAFYNLFVGTYFTFHWMSMAHSCLNPLIYCFMNPKFRKDLHELICASGWFGCRRGPLVRRARRFGAHSSSARRLQSQNHTSLLGSTNRRRGQSAHCARLELEALKRVDESTGDSADAERVRSGAANGNHAASDAPKGRPGGSLKITEDEQPPGERPPGRPAELESSACNESACALATGQLMGRRERAPARRSVEIAWLPGLNKGEDEKAEEVEAAQKVNAPRGSEISPTQLVAAADSAAARCTELSSRPHVHRQQAPRHESAPGTGKSAPAHRKKVGGRLARLMRSLPSSSLFSSFGDAADGSQTHAANITNV